MSAAPGRFLYCSKSDLPSTDANSIQVMHMCDAFSRFFEEVILFPRRQQKDYTENDIHSFYGTQKRFPISDKASVWAKKRAQLRLMQGPFGRESTHVYGRNLNVIASCAEAHIPTTFEAHRAPDQPREQELLQRLVRAPGFCGIVAISGQLAGRLQELAPNLPSEQILVQHDGATIYYADAASAFAGARDQAAVAANPQIGYFGSLHAGKGVQFIAELAPRMPAATFHVYGGSDAEVAAWREAVQAPNVRFHGHVPAVAVKDRMAAMDVLLAPYAHRVTVRNGTDISPWMSPLKIFDYMSVGRPMVCSALPVLKEVLEDDFNAILCEPEDPRAWQQAIEALVANPALRQRIAGNALQRFLANHTWQQRAADIKAFLARQHAGASLAEIPA